MTRLHGLAYFRKPWPTGSGAVTTKGATMTSNPPNSPTSETGDDLGTTSYTGVIRDADEADECAHTSGAVMSIYIAGPMSSIEDFNYPAFNAAAVALRHAGFTVLNPADNELYNPDEHPQARDWYLRRGIRMVTHCTKMALLPGWELSRGARLEHQIAGALKFEIRTLAGWLP